MTKIKSNKTYTRLKDWRAHKLSTLRIGGHDVVCGLSSIGVVSRDVFVSVRDGVHKAWEQTADVAEKQKEAFKDAVVAHGHDKEDQKDPGTE